jgi:hypothetical protein
MVADAIMGGCDPHLRSSGDVSRQSLLAPYSPPGNSKPPEE